MFFGLVTGYQEMAVRLVVILMAAGDMNSAEENQNNSGEISTNAGIPTAKFLEDVDSFMKEPENESAEVALRRLDEQHQKYKFLELNLLHKKKRLKGQIPDIKQTLDILKHLKSKQEKSEVLDTRFLLSDQLYCKAKVPPTDRVCLWLGANVMLEYPVDEAESLLTKNLQAATSSLTQVDNDLDFLRDQYTTTEVNMARVFNWDVKRRQAANNSSGNSSGD